MQAPTQVSSIETTSSTSSGKVCQNCGAELIGKYCHECGQKQANRHDLRVDHFLGHVFHEFTHLDSNKLIRTLRALLFRPGLLTLEYLNGRKGHYISPIRIYLTISFLYFLFGWGILVQTGGGSANRMVSQPWFAAMAEKRGIEPTWLADRVNRKTEKTASALRSVSVFISGLFLTGLFRRQKKYYVEHLIFSLHFYSFDFLIRTAFALLILAYNAAGLPFNTPTRVLCYALLFVYQLAAVRKVYVESWPKTLLKAFVLFAFEMGLFVAIVMLASILAYSMA